ncbi:adenylate/guanylate cyclase domain-containing protein [Winogradskyella sp. A2]|uniref:adenylate/guanylate cyclase domain-containing protein n=1 Tax=Winogradskyella sp. A2 TaxID=3366944 RepID=UPI00398C8302
MKNIITSLVLFCCLFLVNAQEENYYDIWQDETKTDSTRAKAYYTYLFIEYMFDKPDSAIILVDNLKSFAEQNNDLYSLGLSEDIRARSHFYNGDYVNALKESNKALKTFQEQGDRLKISQSLSLIGEIYSDQGDYLRAINYINRSAKIAEEIENETQIVSTNNLIGNIYSNQEDPNNALKYYEKSLLITEKKQNSLSHANVLQDIGVAYDQLEDYNKALQYYNQSEKIYKEVGEQVGLSNILFLKGSVYANQNQFNIALEFFKESLRLDEEFQIEYNSIIKFLEIGDVYLNTNKFREAIKNCKKSLTLSDKYGLLGIKSTSCSCLYEAYKGLGNANQALYYNDRVEQIEDSLKEEELALKLQQMEFAKQVEADSLKQVEIDLRKEMAFQADLGKKNRNKNIAIGAGLLFLILAGGFYSRWRYTKKSKNVIEKEKEKSENLLLNILPAEIAEELKTKGRADARDFDNVSILFTDFKGFTQASEKLSAKELIEEINYCFKAFDHICTKYSIEKIKTIGDAYMAAGGLPVPSEDSIKNTVLAGLEMQKFITTRIAEKKEQNEIFFEMRLGIHTGPVVAGIVGLRKFQYDIWGDTVNTAARMESSGEIGKVNISESTYNHIKSDILFSFKSRGKIQAKGKGEVEMFFVNKV